MTADYTPGDPPVPVGTIVEYHGQPHEVVQHGTPREGTPDPEVNYPDGVAYSLWLVGVPRKLGSHGLYIQVRRTSFRIIEPPREGTT